MSAASPTRSRWEPSALALFLTLVTAHLLMLAGSSVPPSLWSVPAYLWQDAAVALAFALLARLIPIRRAVLAIYWLVIAYAALNVVVAGVLPSPLTPTMLRAARGTLAESIAVYVTPSNLALFVLVLALAAALPVAERRIAPRPRGAPLLLAGLLLVASGPLATSQVATGGGHLNAFGALLPARVPVSAGRETVADWRQGLGLPASRGSFDTGNGAGPGSSRDLSLLRGSAEGRHVVVVILESVGAGYLAPYGAGQDPMPQLTRFASDAVLFESAYAAYPESIKGLFAVLCSRHPALGLPVGEHATAECPSLAEQLRRAGYRSGLFHSGRFDYLGMRDIVETRGFDTLADAGTITGQHDSSFGIDEASTVAAMLDWVDGADTGQPFFLLYLPIAGHHPYATNSPGPFDGADDRGRYLNAIHEADAAFGQLLAGLQQRSLLEQSLLVVFGDHGEAFGQHEGNMAHSFFLYQENVHVPYLIAMPGRADFGARIDRPLSVVDTAPTVLDLLGLPAPAAYEGTSALDGSMRIAFFVTDYARSLLGLVDGCWKLIHSLTGRETELYDLCRDPAESIDLSARESGVATRLRDHVEAWAAAQRESLGRGVAD